MPASRRVRSPRTSSRQIRGTRSRFHSQSIDRESPTRRLRFARLDEYRIQREWKRYAGTPQRDLFRMLRERFLRRHTADMGGWILEVGPGPGRFTPFIGAEAARLVLLDLSRGMLVRAQRGSESRAHLLRTVDCIEGDAVRPPFRRGKFSLVVLLGNALGFAGRDAERLISSSLDLAADSSRIVVEIVAGPGEGSRYLHRMPPSSLPRLFHSPVSWLTQRVEREGFRTAGPVVSDATRFRRIHPKDLSDPLGERGFLIRETVAVAPATGHDPDRIAALQADPVVWDRLLQVEERLGRSPERWELASAILLAFERTTGPGNGMAK